VAWITPYEPYNVWPLAYLQAVNVLVLNSTQARFQ